jgi:peptidylprolyl isomerase
LKKLLFLFLALILTVVVVACGPATPKEDPATENIEGIPAYNASDIITTDSGLRYVIIEEGTGDVPLTGDTVMVDYTGWLEDGTQFDSSVGTGRPLPVVVGRGAVIQGWDEALSLLPVGTQALLLIPSELGYGPNPNGIIPADANLTFEVDILELIPVQRATEVDEGDYTTTDSGLKYYDIAVGDGATPAADEEVSVDFVAWGPDGAQLGSSLENGAPLFFQIGREQMLPAIEEGVSTMNIGGKRQLVISAEEAGIPGGAPGDTVIFEVELVDSQPVPLPTAVADGDYTVLESGVKIYDIEEGDGAMLKDGDMVVLEFVLWLADGTKLDSSAQSGVPLTFPLGGGQMPLAGLEEGVAGMQAGGKRQIVIPATEAALAGLPADQDSIFEVELLGNQ